MAKENNDNTKSFFRWLDVIRAISGDRILSAPDIAKVLGTSLRNAYYVIKALSAYGFFVNHNKLGYNLDRFVMTRFWLRSSDVVFWES